MRHQPRAQTRWTLWAVLLSFLLHHCAASLVDGDVYGIIVSSSRFWFNYRHSSNVYAVYDAMRRLGTPDDRILLYLAHDHACDARNSYTAQQFNSDNDDPRVAVTSPTAEVDFAGADVTPEALLRAITGRHTAGTHPRQRIEPSRTSTLVVYLTGHGGDGFLKFHDKEELTYRDFALALADAFEQGRYGRALVLVDTCQAASLALALSETHLSPSVVAIASSVVGQNSYATGFDSEIGLSLADGFTRHMHDLLQKAWPQRLAVADAAAGLGAGASANADAGLNAAPLEKLCRDDPAALPVCKRFVSRHKDRDVSSVGSVLLPSLSAHAQSQQRGGGAGTNRTRTTGTRSSSNAALTAAAVKLTDIMPPDWRISSTITAHARLFVADEASLSSSSSSSSSGAGASSKPGAGSQSAAMMQARAEPEGRATNAWTKNLFASLELIDFLGYFADIASPR
jgi:hypothetical protein